MGDGPGEADGVLVMGESTRYRETKKTGSYDGKSNKLGFDGRATQLKAKGVPGGVIGAIARAKRAAPRQANYRGGHKGK